MDINRFEYLLRKQLESELSEPEQAEFDQLLLTIDPELQQAVIDRLDVQGDPHMVWETGRRTRIYDNIQQAIANENGRRTRYTGLVAAVALFVVLSAAAIWYWSDLRLSTQYQTAEKPVQDIYLVQEERSTLRLPDGKTIVLKDNDQKELTMAGLKRMIDQQGEEYYQAVAPGKPEQAVGFLTFRSAKGHTSRIVLADGSSVVLNSGSSLYYPRAFDPSKREVRLEGEAFFDVAHDARHPFFVQVKGATIKVLGTSFNLTAYPDEKEVTATLVEGSVYFSNQHSSVYLKPGEQAIAQNNQTRISKKIVDAKAISLWREGYFYFEDQSVASILNAVKRWYDIAEINVQATPEERFSGTFKRTKSLNQLLRNLQKLGSFNYHINERRVTIME